MQLDLFIKNAAENNVLIDDIPLLAVINDFGFDIHKGIFRINSKHISCQPNLIRLAAAFTFFDSIVEHARGKCK